MNKQIKSRAKLNLSLEVLRRRNDGYHEIRSLMIPIDIFDRITLITGDGEGIECHCVHPDVPDGPANLAHKAASSFMESTGERFALRIDIEKRIPVGAGLGGGSGNAAAVLKELNRMKGSPLSRRQLGEVAAAIGSDAPFFLRDGPQWAEGRGERLRDAQPLPDWTYLTLFPGFKIEARWAYNHLPLTFFTGKNTIKCLSLEGVRLVNHLEVPVVERYPVIDELKERLLARGARAALMSGSGPSVFGVFDDKKAAEEVAGVLSDLPDVEVFLAHAMEKLR